MDIPIIRHLWAAAKSAYRQYEFRRQVEFTVGHEVNRVVSRTSSSFTGTTNRADFYVLRITNKSPSRDLVVRRVWLETTPVADVTAKEFKIDPDHSSTQSVERRACPGNPWPSASGALRPWAR